MLYLLSKESHRITYPHDRYANSFDKSKDLCDILPIVAREFFRFQFLTNPA